jgi:hypothetical protein
VVFPGVDELDLVVVVLAEIDIDLHHIFEVFGDDRHSHVVFVVDDDVQDLRCQDLALHQQHDIGLVQF